jgi:short-subunit dehydrogenase
MAYAERLGRDGFDLIVVARRRDRLEDLKHSLESTHEISVEVLATDLSTVEGMGAVVQRAGDPRLDTVIDNAALAHYMPFIELPSEKAEELVKLNALGPLRLIHAALPGMVDRGHGTLVSIATNLVSAGQPRRPSCRSGRSTPRPRPFSSCLSACSGWSFRVRACGCRWSVPDW